MVGEAFCSYWNRHSGCGFAFPACDTSTKITTYGLTECLIHHLGIPHSIASDQGTHFTIEVWQWAHAHKINWSYHFLYHCEVAGLIEQWDSTLKTQLQCQLGNNTFLGQGVQEGCVCSESVFSIQQCFSHHQESRDGNRSDTTISPSGQLANFCFLFPQCQTLRAYRF